MTETQPKSDRVLARLNDRTATIGIVGLGYVGLPLLLPQLILATRMTTGALQGTPWSMLGEIPLFLAALSAGTSVMACILFPYIWRA